MRVLPAFLTLTFAALARAVVGPAPVTGNTAVHDPTMCKDSSGKYWIFSTAVGIEIRTSTDRLAWTLIGTVWPNGASWTDAYTGTSNGNLWAPDCYYSDGQFYLYYAASSFGSQNSAIFFAKSSTGLPGSWANEGLVTSTSTSNNYNAIDPNLYVEGSNWYLSLGSFWTGIKLMTLSSSTGKTSGSTVTSLAQRTANGGAIEASVIYKYGSYYYLFSSWDNCCQGTSSTYNIRVGRSSTVNGGYVDQSGVALTSGGGTLVLGSHDNIIGPGGQDVMTDVDGLILVYHYYTSTGSFLGINKLDFSSGWPVVTSAGSVTTSTTTAHSTTASTVHTSSTTSHTTTTTSHTTSTTASGTGGTAPHYGQCGGIGWTGPTQCAAGFTCQVSNPYYSQCL